MKVGFFKSSLIYGGLSVLARFSAVITAPILTRAFSVADYGVADTLATAIAIASLLVGLNLDSGVFRLYYEKKESDRGSLLKTALFLYLGASSLLTLVVLLFPATISRWIFADEGFSRLVWLAMIRFPSLLAFQQGCSLLRMLGRPYAFAAYNLLLTAGNIIVVVALYQTSSLSLTTLIAGQSAVHLVVALLLILQVWSHYRGRFHLGFLKEVLHYSLPQMPSLLMNFLIVGSMPFLITQMSSTYDTGVYALAQRMSQLFAIVVFAFRTAYDPVMMKIMAERPLEQFVHCSQESFRFYLLLLPLLFLFLITIPPLFPLFIDPKFRPALEILPYLAVSHFLLGLHNIFGLGIAYRKKTRFLSYAQGSAALFFVVLCYPLLSSYGYLGAAWLVLGATSLQTVAILCFSQQLLAIDYQLLKVVPQLVVISLLCMGGLFLQVAAGGVALILALQEYRRNRFLEAI